MTPTEPRAGAWLGGLPRRAPSLAGLLRPVDGAWLGALRFLYGVALAVSMLRFVQNGWIERFFVEPRFFFKYWGFAWVEPLSGPALHALFWALGGLSLCVALGFYFRLSAVLFALGLCYVQLIDVSTYLNHYYLAALLALLLAASPAGRVFSVDAWLRARRGAARAGASTSTSTNTNTSTSAANGSVAVFWLYLFRFQVGVVYVFAGLAKLQGDWLLHAQPLSIWLGTSTDLPLIGALFTLPGVPLLMSWCGFLFDTTIVAFLLHPRARPYAYLAVVIFHALTRALFPIGMFPVIMTLTALVFFSPSWPRAWLVRLAPWRAAATEPAPVVARGWQRLGVGLGLAYCALQLLLPLRHLAYGGNVLWHEQGMRFSWRVMLRAKGGGTTFVVHSPALRKTWHVSPRSYLTLLQESEMSSQPDLIVQLAHHVRDDFRARGLGDVEVRAEARVALNGRRSAPLIDPRVDLARVEDGLSRAGFILPAPEQPPPHTRPVL